MRLHKLSSMILAVSVVCCAVVAQAITIDTVPVGNAGNAHDSTGYGGVAYSYQMGKYEVTNTEYTAFLNAVAQTSDPYGLYSNSMGSSSYGGIKNNGTSGTKYYTKTNMGDKPVNYVSWYDAARFTNWLGNGQGTGSTETGAYTLSGNTGIITKNVGATVYISSEDEWYKAAYYKGGSTTAGYWTYPTKSNTAPTMATADVSGNISNPGANVANYAYGADWNDQNGNVTTVGSAGAASASYCGTFDQGGNVWEWNDAVISSSRGVRGGSFIVTGAGPLAASDRYNYYPTYEGSTVGFRVASVPEPGSLIMIVSGAIATWAWRRRRRA